MRVKRRTMLVPRRMAVLLSICLLPSVAGLVNAMQRPRRSVALHSSHAHSAPEQGDFDDDEANLVGAPLLQGPTVPEDDMLAALEVEDLGLVLEVGPSAVAPCGLGLFARLAAGVRAVELPEMTLLAGYSRGEFRSEHFGDKTVGFVIPSGNTAVFFQQKLMSVETVLGMVDDAGEEAQLAGHVVERAGEGYAVRPTNDDPCFLRYFVPEALPGDLGEVGPLLSARNFGQFCNDRAFVPGMTNEAAYLERAAEENCVELVWRVEYDSNAGLLVPSWPLSVLSRDCAFANSNPIELGTTYGWNYWDASVRFE